MIYVAAQRLSSRFYRAILVFTALLLVLSLGTCSGLLKSGKPVKKVFLLQPLSSESLSTAQSGETLPLQLTSGVVPGLDTDRILVLGRDSSLTPVANARWADNLPEVFSSVMRRSLANSGRYAPTDRRGKADNQASLHLEVQAFFGIGSGDETHNAEIALEVVIECLGASHTLHISDSEIIGSGSLSRIVAAHQRALDSATRQLISALDRHCID